MKISLGVGCDRHTPAEVILQCVDEALAMAGATRCQIDVVATIDLKADEVGLLEAARTHAWPLRFYPAVLLAQVVVPNPSEMVRKYTGTPSVSEAAAMLAAAVDATGLLIEKHKLRGSSGHHVTVSIARMA